MTIIKYTCFFKICLCFAECGFHRNLNHYIQECMLSHFSHAALCNPMDCSQPGSSVLGIFQARILYWVAISSSSIFSTQGLNPLPLCLLHCRWILYQLNHTSDKSINGNFFNMKHRNMKSFLFVHLNYGNYMYSPLDLVY